VAPKAESQFLLGEYRLILDTRVLLRDGQTVRLPKRPYQVLLYLIEHRNRLVTRQELFDHFWDGKDIYEETLTKCIGVIRKALDDDSARPRFIETRYAEGYRYIGSFEEIPASDSSPSEAETIESFRPNGANASFLTEEELLENPAPTGGDRADAGGFARRDEIPTPLFSEAQPLAPRSVRNSRKLAFSLVSLLVAIVICGGVLFYARRSRRPSEPRPQALKPIHALAVLPLKNLTGDPERDFFSDGITESLITQLSKAENLQVISRSSVFTFKNKEIDPREVGRQLGVDAILEGGVRQNKNEIWLDVRLVSTTDGHILWSSEEHKRKLRDIFDIQDEISCHVANNLQLLLCGKDAEVARRYTNNTEAYEAYLKGRYYWYKRSQGDMKEALKFFEESVAKDPNYALGYLGLAETYGIMQINRQVPPNSVVAQAKLYAQKALRIDPTLARAYAIEAMLAGFIEWKWPESERLCQQALAYDSKDSYIYGWYGNILLAQGRFGEAEAALGRAQELDPLKASIASSLGETYCYAQQPDRCIEQAQKMLQTFGQSADVYRLLAWANAEKGDYAESLHNLDKYHADKLSYADYYAQVGKQTEARQLIENEINAGTYNNSPSGVAKYYALMGDKEKAFAWLERACDEHDTEVVSLKIDSAFAPLQTDARYDAILRRIGMSR